MNCADWLKVAEQSTVAVELQGWASSQWMLAKECLNDCRQRGLAAAAFSLDELSPLGVDDVGLNLHASSRTNLDASSET